MNEVQIFNNPEFGEIRSVLVEGEPWFVGRDVAEALGYEKPTDAVRKHVDKEDRGLSKMETPSGTQGMTIINESGLYSLIFSSQLPTAKKFKRWVTSEVLPAIRKTGSYATALTPLQLHGDFPSPEYFAAQDFRDILSEMDKLKTLLSEIGGYDIYSPNAKGYAMVIMQEASRLGSAANGFYQSVSRLRTKIQGGNCYESGKIGIL